MCTWLASYMSTFIPCMNVVLSDPLIVQQNYMLKYCTCATFMPGMKLCIICWNIDINAPFIVNLK